MRPVMALVWLAGCGGGQVTSQVIGETGRLDDLEPPIIDHTPVTTAQPFGADVLIEAIVTDTSGVISVSVHYRQETSVEWKTKAMAEVGGDLYQGWISGDDVGSGGMRYYLEATDYEQNTGCMPEDCEVDPWDFAVTP